MNSENYTHSSESDNLFNLPLSQCIDLKEINRNENKELGISKVICKMEQKTISGKAHYLFWTEYKTIDLGQTPFGYVRSNCFKKLSRKTYSWKSSESQGLIMDFQFWDWIRWSVLYFFIGMGNQRGGILHGFGSTRHAQELPWLAA